MSTHAQASLFPERRRRPPPAPERRVHIAVADLLRRAAKPGVLFTHIASGEYRTDATAALLKRLGVVAGWPDFIFIDGEGRVAFMELKRRGGKLSPAQQAFRDACLQRGVRHAVARSFGEAVACLKGWDVLKPVAVQ